MPGNDAEFRSMGLDTTEFVVPLLSAERQKLDLANSLMAITGIGWMEVDLAAHTVTVHYDRDYVSPGTIGSAITGSGYPLEGTA